MKTSAALTGVILAFSVVVWTLLYLLTPGGPLTAPETLVVVGICSAIVLGIRRVWTALLRARERHAEKV